MQFFSYFLILSNSFSTQFNPSLVPYSPVSIILCLFIDLPAALPLFLSPKSTLELNISSAN